MKINLLPVPKPRMTQRDRWAKRPAVVKYYAYCDELREIWKKENGDIPVSHSLKLEFGIPMPNSWSQKRKKQLAGSPHQQRPDIDNLVKAFLDALCEDDSYIFHIHASKYWDKVDGTGYILYSPLDHTQ